MGKGGGIRINDAIRTVHLRREQFGNMAAAYPNRPDVADALRHAQRIIERNFKSSAEGLEPSVDNN